MKPEILQAEMWQIKFIKTNLSKIKTSWWHFEILSYFFQDIHNFIKKHLIKYADRII